jgi:two-component system response regulator AlgR
VKILVVDDEALARERLLRLLSRLDPDAEVFEAAGGERALELVEELTPDLMLLDIRMPVIDGIEVAARLAQVAEPPAIIFCTAYDQYALDALKHQAVAYLLKPVREADLQAAIGRAGRVNKVQLASLRDSGPRGGGRTTVSSQTHRGWESVEVASVRCFTADQKYVTAHTPDAELVIPDTLKDLENEFGDQFVRVHRSALVALAHLDALRKDEVEGWVISLLGVDIRPAVSRRHLAEVKKRLQQR